MSKELSDMLHISIESIGAVFGTINTSELTSGNTTTLGWLLSGLSRLAMDVDNSRGEMQQVLSQIEKAA